MSNLIYHQVGHNSVWNVDSFIDDNAGDGLILSPVHMSKDRLDNSISNIESSCLFDPQFYLPNSQKTKLNSYDFFPEKISGGYGTLDFGMYALESARGCLNYQVKKDFKSIVIPARYFNQLDSNYIEKQQQLSLLPFIKALRESPTEKTVYLTLPLTSHMIISEKFRIDLLNWVTSFEEIGGLYLVTEVDRRRKQIADGEFIEKFLLTLRELKAVGLEVIVGYCNTESLLYSMIDGLSVTFGSFENTRIFSIDKFVVSDEDRRGPKARIYLPGLLNWITFEHAKQIRSNLPDLWNDIHIPTPYSEPIFDGPTDPTFNQPGLYKHHFVTFYQQYKELSLLPEIERYTALRSALKNAREYYAEIEEEAIDLDTHGGGSHIQIWLDCLNSYYRDFLK